MKPATALLAAGAGTIGLLALTPARDAAAAPGSVEAQLARSLCGFGRPVPSTVRAIVSSGWGQPRGDRLHRALDIPIPVGTPVLAIEDGIVVRAQTEDRSDAGRWAGVIHHAGFLSRYLHLSRCLVRPGQAIVRGAQLGLSGDTGNSATPHLHLDLRAPTSLLPRIAAWVGVPRGGWGPPLEPYGCSIPGEPWIPVDGYRERVRRDAERAGIPLYPEVRHGG